MVDADKFTKPLPRLRIRQVMEDRKLSVQALAHKSGCSDSDVSKIVSGRQIPFAPQLARICATLQWPPMRALELIEPITTDGEPTVKDSDPCNPKTSNFNSTEPT